MNWVNLFRLVETANCVKDNKFPIMTIREVERTNFAVFPVKSQGTVAPILVVDRRTAAVILAGRTLAGMSTTLDVGPIHSVLDQIQQTAVETNLRERK